MFISMMRWPLRPSRLSPFRKRAAHLLPWWFGSWRSNAWLRTLLTGGAQPLVAGGSNSIAYEPDAHVIARTHGNKWITGTLGLSDKVVG